LFFWRNRSREVPDCRSHQLSFGAKADSSVIREGAEECSVSGTLFLEDSPLARKWLDEHDIAYEDYRVNLRRGFRNNGRSFVTSKTKV